MRLHVESILVTAVAAAVVVALTQTLRISTFWALGWSVVVSAGLHLAIGAFAADGRDVPDNDDDSIAKTPAIRANAGDELVVLHWQKGLSWQSSGKASAEDPTQINVPEDEAKRFSELYSMRDCSVGAGSFGECRLGRLQATGKPCVVKVVDKEIAGVSYMRIHRKQDNFDTLLKISQEPHCHPNVVKYFDFLMGPDLWFVIMEPLSGVELFDDIVAKAPVDEAYLQSVTRQVLSAMQYIHEKNIIHRDMKLDSCKWRSDDAPHELVVLDFGLSCPALPQENRNAVGTLLYTAPEVLTGSYSTLADVWSVGVMLYVMATGSFPFAHDVEEDKVVPGFKTGEAIQELHENEEMGELVDNLASLLKGLLVGAEERLTAADALATPWLQKEIRLARKFSRASPKAAHYEVARHMSSRTFACASPKTPKKPDLVRRSTD